jgi:hypothetical protein
MSCREHRSGLLELGRGAALEEWERQTLLLHVEHCAECAVRLDEQKALHAALHRLSVEVPAAEEEIGTRVMAEFDRAVAARRRAKVSVGRWMLPVGLAASVLVASLWMLGHSPARPPVATDEEAPFLTIPYTIPLAPEERAEVVRMRIPVAALLAAGFHVQVSDPSVSIDAEVLVSQDGRARAIRPLTAGISD